MNQPKEYSIKSFEDVCNTITPDNADRFLTDVHNAFASYLAMIEGVRAMCPEETKGLSNWQVSEFQFTWVDDGKNEWLGTTIEGADGTKVTIDHKKKN